MSTYYFLISFFYFTFPAFIQILFNAMLFSFIFQTVSVAVSVLTLSAISIERWYAICHPLSFKSTPSRARNIIFSIWVFSACVAVPDLITAQLYHTLPAYYNDVQLLLSCRPSWSERSQFIYQMFLLIGLYFLPFCLMAFTYTMIALVLWREDIPGVNETSRGKYRKKILIY